MMTSTDGQFILDLSPRHPIYLELLENTVRDAVGRVHRDGRPARVMLEREGFVASGLVDIFDGGSTMTCRRDQIGTLRANSVMVATIVDQLAGDPRLVSTGRLRDFRAGRALAEVREDSVAIDRASARALNIEEGMVIRVRV